MAAQCTFLHSVGFVMVESFLQGPGGVSSGTGTVIGSSKPALRPPLDFLSLSPQSDVSASPFKDGLDSPAVPPPITGLQSPPHASKGSDKVVIEMQLGNGQQPVAVFKLPPKVRPSSFAPCLAVLMVDVLLVD